VSQGVATLLPLPLEYKSQPTTPLMDFDTDFWSEIQDAPGEIFDMDIPELRDEDEDEQTWNEFVNSNVTL
jgi:hypothetical protein